MGMLVVSIMPPVLLLRGTVFYFRSSGTETLLKAAHGGCV